MKYYNSEGQGDTRITITAYRVASIYVYASIYTSEVVKDG
jgi:hypothetical protein